MHKNEEIISEDDLETAISKVYFTSKTADLSDLKIFSGSSNKELAHEIAAHLDIHLGRCRIA